MMGIIPRTLFLLLGTTILFLFSVPFRDVMIVEAFIVVAPHSNSFARFRPVVKREWNSNAPNHFATSTVTSSFPVENNTAAAVEGGGRLLDSDDEVALEQSPTSSSSNNKTVAVLLNLNARSVNHATVALAREVFGENAVYVSETAEQAEAAAKCLVKADMVVPIGGDGTLTYCLNLMNKERRNHPMPEIAYIPYGTGNAVGSVAGCVRNQSRRKRKLRKTMQMIRDAATTSPLSYSILELPILQVQMGSNQTNDSTLCFFAGAGFDSLMLNDFRILQRWSRRTGILRSFLGSVAGYCVALVTRTLPAAALKNRHQVQVKIVKSASDQQQVLWIDHRRGDFAQVIHDDVLYEGQAGIVAASTVPYYGGHLRLFPFARVNLNTMQLRIGRIHPVKGFWNIPQIFAGSYRDTSERFGVLDFLGTEFEVQLRGIDGKEYPFQHSGESVGEIKSFRLKVADEPIRFVSFWDKKSN